MIHFCDFSFCHKRIKWKLSSSSFSKLTSFRIVNYHTLVFKIKLYKKKMKKKKFKDYTNLDKSGIIKIKLDLKK